MSILTAALPLPVSGNDLLFFTKHLGVLVTSGVPIGEALAILQQQSKNPSLTRIIDDLRKTVLNGKTLSEALERHKGTFSSFYRSIIAIGEESGTLDKNLTYLATELEKNLEFKRQLQGILLYPSIVVGIAILVAAGISIFILPQLADLFSSLNITLPLTTRILLTLSVLSRQYGVVFFLSLISLFIFSAFLFSRRGARVIIDPILIRLPIIGPIIENSEVANMCRNIGLMLKAGMPITRAMEVARDSTDNTVFSGYLDRMYKAVEGGRSLEMELQTKHYSHLPATLPRMLGVGEHSGTLDESFLYLGDFYAEEVSNTTKNLPTILEPILLVAIAGVVLFVALAIITPIYQFTGSIHK